MKVSATTHATARPSRALTTIVFEMVHEDGHEGRYGRAYLSRGRHPYSRDVAARFARWRYAQGLCDGFEIVTPGYVAPERPAFIDLDGLPF